MNNERNIENLYSALSLFADDFKDTVNAIFYKNIVCNTKLLGNKVIIKVDFNNEDFDEYNTTYEFSLNSDNKLLTTFS